jgi:glutathione S-transferase
LFNPALQAEAREQFADAVVKKFAWVSQQLRGKKYLTGEVFTAADAYLFVIASWAPYLKFDLGGCSELQAFMQRVGERPAVQAALNAEGLLG